MIHKEWGLERKAQVVLRGVMPMTFSGCETVHVSLSTFSTIRAKMNTVVLGRWSSSSHLLSALFATKTVYEPLIYVLRTRLASLRMCISVLDLRKLRKLGIGLGSLISPNQHKIYGPVALLIWSCQILKWEVLRNFHVRVAPGVVLHLLATPKKTVSVFLEQAWVDYVLNHFTHKHGACFGDVQISFRT